MKVKILENGAQLPIKAHDSDAGWDLYSTDPHQLFTGNIVAIRTGVAVEIPIGCVGIIKDRSSMALKGVKVFGGVIDAEYTGELVVFLMKVSVQSTPVVIHSYDKIAQLIVLPLAPIKSHLEIVEKFTETERGEKGFGSSDENVTHYIVSSGTACNSTEEFLPKNLTSNPFNVTCKKCISGMSVNYESRKSNPNKT